MKTPAEIDPTNQVVFATRQDDEVRSKSVPPPDPSGFALLFLLDDVDSARAVALFEGLPVRTDRGTVDSGGRTVGVESGSVVVRTIVVEESREANADEVAVSVTELAGVENTVLVLVFAVAIDVGDSATEGLRLVTEDVQDVDPATTDPVSLPSSPAAPGSGSEPSCTFGQSFATASPENNIPINEPRGAIVPLQALLTLTVSFSRNSMQPEEHALPLIKSVAAQPVRGVLYASVQA
ncbi:hypothetical protein MMC22_002482 [Lobaria immixta]|nr:hypothetical protein [Lobaria immixta]